MVGRMSNSDGWEVLPLVRLSATHGMRLGYWRRMVPSLMNALREAWSWFSDQGVIERMEIVHSRDMAVKYRFHALLINSSPAGASFTQRRKTTSKHSDTTGCRLQNPNCLETAQV